ncbi:MAG: hypothetical protein IJS68_02900 [Clostridia bacterium]|nr:hypothetical protein [Clostridia bacterium]
MAFEFNEMSLSKEKQENVCQFSISGKFSSQDDSPVKRVLDISLMPKITECDNAFEFQNFSGVANVQIAYENDDGEIDSIAGTIEWQNKVEIENISNASLMPYIIDKETKISGSTIYVNAMVGVAGYGQSEIKIAIPQEDNSLVVKKEERSVVSLEDKVFEKFNIIEDVQLDDDFEPMVSHGAINVVDVVCNDGSATINGQIAFEMLAKSEDGIKAITKTIDFSQEVECARSVAGNTAFAIANVENVSVVVSKNNEQKTMANITAECGACVYVYKNGTISVALDAYSCDQEVMPAITCADVSYTSDIKTYKEEIAAETPIEELPEIDEVVATICYDCVKPNLQSDELKTTLSGAVIVQVIYRNESKELCAQTKALPYEYVLDGQYCQCLGANASIKNYRLHAGHGLEINAEVNFTLKQVQEEFLTFVSEINIVGEKEDDDAGVVMLITKENEDLFAVSKELKVRPEVVSAQNETEDFSSKNQVFVYKTQTATFEE